MAHCVLIIEDEPDIRKTIDYNLSKESFKVVQAESIAQGEKALAANKIDVIILDLMLPDGSGLTLCRDIKSDAKTKHIPIIILTAKTEEVDRVVGFELGADDYVTKPFDKMILEARISACIEKKLLRDKEKQLLEEIRKEKEKSDSLLLNILPKEIADRLKSGEELIADKHNEVSVLFADIIEFTPQSQNLNPKELVSILNTIFTQFDDLSTKYNIEKIKTIGDNYFAVAGLRVGGRKSAIDLINMAKEMITTVNNINDVISVMNVSLRVGIHTGPIVAGVIGKNKFAYDLWGATVNKASRMESSGDKNKIQI